ncbi:hypothetical protein MKX53_18880 [Psychrobacillus sp. FSL K6-4615]|uniref:hypothetical protein n=1 Tax=Psychrobacillus sp. FSL K6-4615 TaxID=2921551 RepID=UPI0030F684CA
MYYVELQEDLKQCNVVSVYISIGESLFLNYLTDKLLLFPLHIAFEENFWRHAKPYIGTYQNTDSKSNLFKLNTAIQVVIPNNSLTNSIPKTKESLADVLLNWLDESYSEFQINHKNKRINSFGLTV